MTFVIFSVGGLFCILGQCAYLVGHRACRRVVKATKGCGGGLSPTEAWLNSYQLTKWRKLRAIAASDEDNLLRADASRALRFEGAFFILFAAGLVLMALAAAQLGTTQVNRGHSSVNRDSAGEKQALVKWQNLGVEMSNEKM